MEAVWTQRVNDEWRRLRRFLTEEAWDVQVDSLPKRKALLYRAARVAYTTARALFFDDTLQVRAAALTYFTVLSLVPLLAFAFALLKGFGAYDALIEQTIRPYLLETFSANPALHRAFDQLLDFVAGTGVASLGTVGLVALLYAATRLLRNIEVALNEIWGVQEARGPLEQVRDYVAIIVVTPICLLAAFALTTVGQLVETIRVVEERLGLNGASDWLIGTLGPFCVIFGGLMFLYTVMPNTAVRAKSAAAGALIGALLWLCVLILHVRFQVGVARFNALYSGFAAVPIFLVWLHLSWLTILVGAQSAAAHQNSRALALRMRMTTADQAFKEVVCLSAVLRIARAFAAGNALPTLAQLSAGSDATESMLRVLLERPIAAGIILASGSATCPTYALARAPELIRVKHVLDALRRTQGATPGEFERAPGVDPTAAKLWQDLDRRSEQLPENRTLAELIDAGRASQALPAGKPELGPARASQH
jgi:membrane protein